MSAPTAVRAVPIGHLTPGTDAWHEARRMRVGGSEIAAVLGISPWESRFSLWHRKMGALDPVDETPAMAWGTRLEPLIADEFARLHPDVDVRPAATFIRPDRPYQTAAPDRLAYRNRITARPGAVIEIKTSRTSDDWGDPGTDQVPVHYRAQVLWYLDTLGLDAAHVAVLVGGSDFREYHLTHDPVDAQTMRDAAATFVASLAAGERPDIDAHSATYAAVRELHPDIDDVAVDIPETVARPYLRACDDERDVAERKQLAVARLLDAMGSARRAYFEGEQIAIRVPGRGDGPPSLRQSRRSAA